MTSQTITGEWPGAGAYFRHVYRQSSRPCRGGDPGQWGPGALLGPQVAPGEEVGRDSGASRQEFLTVDQAADVLHVSRDNIYDLIRRRHLRSIKIGRSRRISRQWIAQFAEQQQDDEASAR